MPSLRNTRDSIVFAVNTGDICGELKSCRLEKVKSKIFQPSPTYLQADGVEKDIFKKRVTVIPLLWLDRSSNWIESDIERTLSDFENFPEEVCSPEESSLTSQNSVLATAVTVMA